MLYDTLLISTRQEETTAKAICCLRKSDNPPANIFVLDVTGTAKAMCDNLYVSHIPNIGAGFASNVNVGLEATRSPYMFLCGVDVYVLPWAASTMLKDPRPNCVEQMPVLDTAPVRRITPPGGFTNMMIGNCAMIPVGFARKHNLQFNEDLHTYCEETAFGYEWLRHGGTIRQHAECGGVHDHKGGYYHTNTKHTKKYYYLARNSVHLGMRYPEGRLLALKIAIGLCLLKPSKDVFTGIWHGLNGVYGPHPQDPIIQQD